MSVMLNLGCGTRFHPDWINVDAHPASPEVLKHDLRYPLPFADNSIDAIYHSHLLEHFSRRDALRLLRECYRVCRPGGVIRVVVPDLEAIVRLYLECLNQVSGGDLQAAERYDWMMLELFDQAVRTNSGGEILEFVRKAESLEEFIIQRIGNRQYLSLISLKEPQKPIKRFGKLIRNPAKAWYYLRRGATSAILTVLWGKVGWQLADQLHFRMRGEIHQWMYDRFSLGRLLAEAGFSEALICSAHKSRIPNWDHFGLDTEADGSPYKPDSLYCEAIRRPR